MPDLEVDAFQTSIEEQVAYRGHWKLHIRGHVDRKDDSGKDYTAIRKVSARILPFHKAPGHQIPSSR